MRSHAAPGSVLTTVPATVPRSERATVLATVPGSERAIVPTTMAGSERPTVPATVPRSERANVPATVMATALMAVLASVAAGCHVVPPMPTVPMHGSTDAAPVGETTVTIVVGIAMQPLGGAGVGVALRAQRQETDRTALGLELTGGRFEASDDKLWLFAVRGYGQGTPRAHDWLCARYGVGMTVLTTGMVAVNAHAGGAVGYPNDVAVPYLQLGVAGSVPVIAGRAFANLRDEAPQAAWREHPERRLAGHPVFDFTPARHPTAPRADIFLFATSGIAVPISDTGHRASLELGLAAPQREDDAGMFSLSVADEVR